jgi:methylphosphotriester-DNA--protein-cysteine methyltransferase
MKKRLVSMLLVFCCLLSLVGCGGGTSEPVESDKVPSSSGIQSSTAPDPVTEPTETPESSTNPQPAESPEPSTEPQPTETPEPSTEPQPTETPEPSTEPQPAETPEPSTEPQATDTPTPTPNPVPDGPYYILNTSSKKFHDPDCGSASEISASNKEYYTGTAEELVAKGYEPCGNCKPYEMPEPEPEPEPTPTETMVWIPSSGTKYHSKASCSNMKNPTQVTKSQAEARGYTPCKKCW